MFFLLILFFSPHFIVFFLCYLCYRCKCHVYLLNATWLDDAQDYLLTFTAVYLQFFWTLAIVSNLWPGIVVFSSGVSACYSTSSLVSTGMGDRLCRHATSVCNQTTWATQSPCLSGMGNGYELKSSEALWPGSKGRHGLFHWWINVMQMAA